MDQTALSARSAEKLGGTIGEHLVHVHVGLRARAGLPDGQREFAVVHAPQRFVRSGDYRVRAFPRQRSQLGVDVSRSAFDQQHGANELGRHFLAGNTEEFERALRLRAPQPVRGHFDRAERVALDAHGSLVRGWHGHNQGVRSTNANSYHILARCGAYRRR